MENIDIKRAIKSRNRKLAEVAEHLGISQSALSQQMQNQTLTIVKLRKIADFLGISVSELVGDGDKASPELVCPHCGKPISIKIE